MSKRLEGSESGESPIVAVRLPRRTVDLIDWLIANLPETTFGRPSKVVVMRAIVDAGIEAVARKEGIKLPAAEVANGPVRQASKKKPATGQVHPRSAARAAKRAAERVAAGCTCKNSHVKTCKLWRAPATVSAS